MTPDIHTLGPVIAQGVDEDGPVRVHELEGHRYLTFGNHVEQSCIELARPHRLAHAYTQAMMLSLLLRPDPAHALVLGLGCGSLVRALHHLDPGLAITAVERRPAVIALAGECLGLETGPHLSIHQAEAETFIAEVGDHYDLVMVDLFLADGAHPAQGERDFLKHCRARLSHDGLLTLNLWSKDFASSRAVNRLLADLFEDRVRHLHVQGGNHIAWCFAGLPPCLDRKRFFAQARELGKRLEIPLQGFARTFWGQNQGTR